MANNTLESDTITFKTRDQKTYQLPRSAIEQRASESWFARAIDPEQKMQVKNADGEFELDCEMAHVLPILEYIKKGDVAYRMDVPCEQAEQVVEMAKYYLVTMPTQWMRCHQLHHDLVRHSTKYRDEVARLAREFLEFALFSELPCTENKMFSVQLKVAYALTDGDPKLYIAAQGLMGKLYRTRLIKSYLAHGSIAEIAKEIAVYTRKMVQGMTITTSAPESTTVMIHYLFPIQ